MSNIKYLLFSLLLVFNSTVFAQDKELVLESDEFVMEYDRLGYGTKTTVTYFDLGENGLIRVAGGYIRYIDNDLKQVWERKASDLNLSGKITFSANGDVIYLVENTFAGPTPKKIKEHLQVIQLNKKGEIISRSQKVSVGTSIDVYWTYSTDNGVHCLIKDTDPKSKTQNGHRHITFSKASLTVQIDTINLPLPHLKVGNNVYAGNTIWREAKDNYAFASPWLYKYEDNLEIKKSKQQHTEHYLSINSNGEQGKEIMISCQPNTYSCYLPQLQQFMTIDTEKNENTYSWTIKQFNDSGSMTFNKTFQMDSLFDLVSRGQRLSFKGAFYNSIGNEYVVVLQGSAFNVCVLDKDFNLKRFYAASPADYIYQYYATASAFFLMGNTKVFSGVSEKSEAKDALSYFFNSYASKDMDLSVQIIDRKDHQLLIVDRAQIKQSRILKFSK